jgi:hypothetical protein
LDTIRAVFAMPLIGVKLDSNGTLVDQCSYFEMDYDGAPGGDVAASVRTANVTHQYLKPLAAGMTRWPTLGAIPSSPNGAIEIRDLHWRIRYPPLHACNYD